MNEPFIFKYNVEDSELDSSLILQNEDFDSLLIYDPLRTTVLLLTTFFCLRLVSGIRAEEEAHNLQIKTENEEGENAPGEKNHRDLILGLMSTFTATSCDLFTENKLFRRRSVSPSFFINCTFLLIDTENFLLIPYFIHHRTHTRTPQ